MATRVSASRWRTAWNVADGPPELDPLQGVARGPARAWSSAAPDQFVAEGQLGQWPRPPRQCAGVRVRCVATRCTPSRHLDQAEARVHALHRPETEFGRGYLAPPRGAAVDTGDDQAVARVDHVTAVPTPRTTMAVPAISARRAPLAERGQDDARRRACLRTQGGADDGVEGRRRGVGRALQLEEDGHGRAGIGRRALRASPSSSRAASRAVRRSGLGRRGGGSRSNSARSSSSISGPVPRSSSRRAMMLRWISAVPP